MPTKDELETRDNEGLRGLVAMGLKPKLTGYRVQYVTMYKRLPDGRIDESQIPLEREWEYQVKEGYSRVKPELGYELHYAECPNRGCTLKIPWPYAEAQTEDAANAIVGEHVRMKHITLRKTWEEVAQKERARKEQERIDEMQHVLRALAGKGGDNGMAELQRQIDELTVLVKKGRQWTEDERAAFGKRMATARAAKRDNDPAGREQ